MFRTLHLYRGYHSRELLNLIGETWECSDLLILVPPNLQDLSFVQTVPWETLKLHGDWKPAQREFLGNSKGSNVSEFWSTPLQRPVLGVFTSGTLGAQRLVLYSKGNIEASLQSIRELFQTLNIRHLYSFPQPFHTFGLTLGYCHSLLHSIPIDFIEGKYSKQSHQHWRDSLTPHTLTLGTPTHFYDLLSQARNAKESPSQSLTCIIGGAPVSPELWSSIQQELKIAFPSIGYGCTEGSPGVSHLRPGVQPQSKGDIGFLLNGVTITFHEEGYLFKGPNLCTAILDSTHWSSPKECLIRDQIHIQPDGRLTFAGRTDLTVNRGGTKFACDLLELQIQALGYKPTYLVPVADERLGEDIVLVTAESEGKLRRALDEPTYPPFLKSSRIIELQSIPMTDQGKVDRFQLKELTENSIQLQRNSEPSTQLKPSFPCPTSQLKHLIPHGESMIWIDTVLEASEDHGRCEVVLSSEKSYARDRTISQSVAIEWMAQACAFSQLAFQKRPLSKTFLGGIRNLRFESNPDFSDKSYVIHVRVLNRVPPLTAVECFIEKPSGELMCRGRLHLFGETQT